MPNLTEIEAAAKALATSRENLAESVTELNDVIAAARRRLTPVIKRRLQRAAEDQAALHALISAAPELFKKPRTTIFHGVRCGYAKGKGVVTWADEKRVVALIKKQLPEQFEALVKTTEKPLKAAIAQLPAADVKRIGCSITEAGDQVVIGFVDSEVDKMVEALLKDAVETEIAEEVA